MALQCRWISVILNRADHFPPPTQLFSMWGSITGAVFIIENGGICSPQDNRPCGRVRGQRGDGLHHTITPWATYTSRHRRHANSLSLTRNVIMKQCWPACCNSLISPLLHIPSLRSLIIKFSSCGNILLYMW